MSVAFRVRDSFARALTRAALVLNQDVLGDQSGRLRLTDDAFMASVQEESFRSSLVRLSIGEANRELAYAEYADFFYGVTSVHASKDPSGVRTLVHLARAAFVELFRRGQHEPGYALADMGLSALTSPAELSTSLAASYLVKNLWHNLVHVERQRINDSNFHFFVGTARDYSDFMADNLATIMLAISYGCEVHADSLADPADPPEYAKPIIHLMRRNRCNRLFALRAEMRREREGAEPPQEVEWRYRRAVAVYLSGWLLASGRAIATVSVELGRSIPELGRGVVVEVNGLYCWLDIPARPLLEETSTPEERRAFRNHLRQIAIAVDQRYRAALATDARRRQHARGALADQLRCLGIVPPGELTQETAASR